jgi:ferritin-like metal-binding protein YciE
MKIGSLRELYIEQLRDLADAEQQIIKALPKMIEKASSEDLKEALNDHFEVTKTQASRLEDIFAALGEKSKGEKCKGMEGVLAEGDELVGKVDGGPTRDAAIIAAAQRVEHYEMAGYGTARTYAGLLGEEDAQELLQQTLDEEEEADETLTELSGEINAEANGAEAEGSEEGEEEGETVEVGEDDSEQEARTARTGKRATASKSAASTKKKRVA